ncbi:hypothetical protein TNCV_1822791 [Trichonephila clavipes]|nr:hypothetical protein TNCV_1822791 [Trichonephila clavipes]
MINVMVFTSWSRTSASPRFVPESFPPINRLCQTTGDTSAMGPLFGVITELRGGDCQERVGIMGLVLFEGDARNGWRDGPVCPDCGQGTMAPLDQTARVCFWRVSAPIGRGEVPREALLTCE